MQQTEILEIGQNESTNSFTSAAPSKPAVPDKSNLNFDSKSINSNLECRKRAFALNFVSDPVIECDTQLNIVWANKEALAFSGLTLKQVLGCNYSEILNGFPYNKAASIIEDSFESGNQLVTKIRSKNSDIYIVTAVPFANVLGQIETVIAIIKNTTPQARPNKTNIKCEPTLISFAENMNSLSKRELQVMGCVLRGQSNKSISNTLKIACKTVEAHRSNVMSKLKVDSLAELARLAALCEFYCSHFPGVLNQ